MRRKKGGFWLSEGSPVGTPRWALYKSSDTCWPPWPCSVGHAVRLLGAWGVWSAPSTAPRRALHSWRPPFPQGSDFWLHEASACQGVPHPEGVTASLMREADTQWGCPGESLIESVSLKIVVKSGWEEGTLGQTRMQQSGRR